MSYKHLLVLPRHTKSSSLHHSNTTTSTLSSRTYMWSASNTPTLYATSTSEYLNRVFFDTYGRDKKLTKEQRNEIIKRTGLTSRRITYWFSNRKRRFKSQVKTYGHLLQQGTITTYDEYLEFLRDNRLPKINMSSKTWPTHCLAKTNKAVVSWSSIKKFLLPTQLRLLPIVC